MPELSQGEKREQTVGRQVAEILLDCGCVTHRIYKSKSGLILPLKVEIDKLRENPVMHSKISELLRKSASENFPGHNYLVAVPTGGISLVRDMHQAGRTLPRARPRVSYRSDSSQFEMTLNSSFLNNANIVVVEDVVTKGTSSRKTLSEIKKELKEIKNGKVLGEVAVFTYGFVDKIDGVEVKALCSWKDLIAALKDRPEDSQRIKYLQSWYATTVASLESKRVRTNPSI